MHSLLVVYSGLTGKLPDKIEARSKPEVILRSCGYIVEVAASGRSRLADCGRRRLYLMSADYGIQMLGGSVDVAQDRARHVVVYE